MKRTNLYMTAVWHHLSFVNIRLQCYNYRDKDGFYLVFFFYPLVACALPIAIMRMILVHITHAARDDKTEKWRSWDFSWRWAAAGDKDPLGWFRGKWSVMTGDKAEAWQHTRPHTQTQGACQRRQQQPSQATQRLVWTHNSTTEHSFIITTNINVCLRAYPLHTRQTCCGDM